jgi:MoCo/4Fe-4S cofactor protein with predicted Tat translocation signal
MSQVNDKPSYWRSLAELENDPEFREAIEREFKVPLDQEPGSPARRRFMQVMGASFALAGLSGCRWKEDKLVDFAKRPQGMVPGEARHYATTMEVGGLAVGLIATSYDGRPVKVEGNPAHPANLGASAAWHQASVLELYDPDRSQSPLNDGNKVDLAAFDEAFKAKVTELKAAGGKGLYILSGASSSPTLAALRRSVAEKYTQSKWLTWDAVAPGDEERAGTKLAFGKAHRVHLDCAKAAVIVSLDADFIGPAFPMGLRNARAVAAGRDPDAPRMNRLYVVEPAFSQIGSIADHRLAIRAELVKAFAAALDAAVSAAAGAADAGPGQPKPSAAFLSDAHVAKFLDALAKDLVAHKGTSLVVAGPHQPAEVHALAARLNTVLGNVGNTVSYTEASDEPSMREQLASLVADLNAGAVDTLLVLDANPVYTAPADLDFTAAYAKAKTRVAVSSYADETAKASTWHVPLAHPLETWSDTLAWDGTLGIGQPLIAPLFGGKAAIEIVARLTEDVAWTPKDLVRRTHKEAVPDDRKWARLVQAGLGAPGQLEKKAPKLEAIAPVKLEGGEAGGLEVGNGQLELLLTACSKIYDGRWANNAWLQELPESFTKLTWGNAALIAPKTAAALGVTDGTPARLTVGGQSIELPVMIAPGQAVGTVTTTQDAHAIDDVGRKGTDDRVPMLVREANLAEYKKRLQARGRLLLWEERLGHVDASACQAREQHRRRRRRGQVRCGREMLWIRVDRYFSGKADDARRRCLAAPSLPAVRERALRAGLPGGRHHAHQRRPERHGLQPLHRHALLREQLPLQGAALQLLQLPPGQGRADAVARRRERPAPGARHGLQPRGHGSGPRRDGEMHLLRAAHPEHQDQGQERQAHHQRRRDQDGVRADLPDRCHHLRQPERQAERRREAHRGVTRLPPARRAEQPAACELPRARQEPQPGAGLSHGHGPKSVRRCTAR